MEFLNNSVMLRVLAIVALATTVGCSQSHSTELLSRETAAQQAFARSVPGVEEHIWEEPMVDVIDVPPGLDPEGHYYRPAHQEVVEIRQGRWKFMKEAEK